MSLERQGKSFIEDKARDIRKAAFKAICSGGGGHIPASLCITELLTVLYNGIMNVDTQNLTDTDRDRFILSKGHSCVALYAVLADKGFFDESHLDTFGRRGSILGGHPDMHKVPGVEASTGALGHGFPFGVGIALAGKMDKRSYRVFTLLGDGECQEGSVWEAAMFAAQHGLDNMVAIIDYNKLQAMDFLDKIVSVSPMAEKWSSFGWEVREVDGHDIEALVDVFSALPFRPGKPNLIVAHTIKGKGVSFMENVPIWHYRMPNEAEMKTACRDLEMEEL
jgi:transketolase